MSEVSWQRKTARGVVRAPDGRLLLQQGHDPWAPAVPPFWFLPGGGMDSGEDAIQALRRELLEECGLCDVEVGPLLWEQRAIFRFAGIDFDQDEQILLVRVPSVTAIEPTALEPLEAAGFLSSRWWRADEILGTSEVVYPLDLSIRLREAGLA